MVLWIIWIIRLSATEAFMLRVIFTIFEWFFFESLRVNVSLFAD